MNGIDLVNYVAGLELPSCSMAFNGFVLEEEVPGYRTTTVTGRDSLSAEIAEYDNGYVDGSTLLHRKFPSRDITVNFTIVSSGQDALRDAYNKLRSILYARGSEEAQIVFKDEADLYYLGTVSNVTGDDVFSWEAASTGSITIHCSTPFKWSLDTFEATADSNGNITVDYDGTYKAYPVLHAKVNNNNLGYIGFVNDRRNIIQLGDPTEVDKYRQGRLDTTLLNDNFVSDPGSFAHFSVKNGITPENRELINRDVQTGEIKVGLYDDDLTNIGNGVTRAFTLKSILSTNPNSRWAGGSASAQLTQSAQNFTCTVSYVVDDIKKNITNTSYHGELRIYLMGTVGGVKKTIASVHVWINTTTDNLVRVEYNVLDKSYKLMNYKPVEQTIDRLSANSDERYTSAQKRSAYSKLAKTITIVKRGDKFDFTSPAGKYSITVPITKNYEVSEVGIWILGLANVTSLSGNNKSPQTQYINGKLTKDGWVTPTGRTINSDNVINKSTAVTPSATYPILLEIYAEKRRATNVSGKIYTTYSTPKKNFKIIKANTNYQTGILNSLVHYNSENKSVNIIAMPTITKYASAKTAHAAKLRSSKDKSSDRNVIKNIGTNKKVKVLKDELIGVIRWLYVEVDSKTKGYLNYIPNETELTTDTKYEDEGYKWYVRGTHYESGSPVPNRALIDSLGVRSIKFVKSEFNKLVDVPNPFTKGDVVDIDCNTGEIQINGAVDYNLGALGNDWEEFCLYPGPNGIHCSFSDWATGKDTTFSLTYRKVYI